MVNLGFMLLNNNEHYNFCQNTKCLWPVIRKSTWCQLEVELFGSVVICQFWHQFWFLFEFWLSLPFVTNNNSSLWTTATVDCGCLVFKLQILFIHNCHFQLLFLPFCVLFLLSCPPTAPSSEPQMWFRRCFTLPQGLLVLPVQQFLLPTFLVSLFFWKGDRRFGFVWWLLA